MDVVEMKKPEIKDTGRLKMWTAQYLLG